MEEHLDKVWKKFLSKHWQMFVAWIIVAILLVIGAIYVFLWFVGDAQPALVPVLLGSWSMGHIITFLSHLIFWEAILIGIPVLIVIVAIYAGWWKKLPDVERKEYKKGKLFGKRSKRTDAGGGISFLIFIVFCILVYLDGKWGVAISTWELNYLVYTCLWALFWIAIIIGIPAIIGGIWWIHHEMKK